MQDMEAVELERIALNKVFAEFQIRNEEHITEMVSKICERCAECSSLVEPDRTERKEHCSLIASMTWHVFAIYFTARSGAN